MFVYRVEYSNTQGKRTVEEGLLPDEEFDEAMSRISDNYIDIESILLRWLDTEEGIYHFDGKNSLSYGSFCPTEKE